MSTIAVVRRETNGWKWPVLQFGYMTVAERLGADVIVTDGQIRRDILPRVVGHDVSNFIRFHVGDSDLHVGHDGTGRIGNGSENSRLLAEGVE